MEAVKIGDYVECVSGTFRGYGGKVVAVDLSNGFLQFCCNDCHEEHKTTFKDCGLTFRTGHHLTRIFK